MKKFIFVVLLLAVGLLTAACSAPMSSSEGAKNEKSALKDVEITLENVSYALPSPLDGQTEQLLLKVDVSIKNNKKELIKISKLDFKLYQEDTAAKRALSNDVVEEIGDVDAGKRMEGSLFYRVDKGEPFKLVFTADLNKDGKQETKEFKIDGGSEELMATAEQLENPAIALNAYIDVLFYAKENPDFEKLTGEDKAKLLQEFDNGLMGAFIKSSGIPENEIDTESLNVLVAAIKATLQEKVPVQTKVKSISGDKAKVELIGKPIDTSNIAVTFTAKAKEAVANTPINSNLELQRLLFSIMAEEYKGAEPTATEEKVTVGMSKNEDGQWRVDSNDPRNLELSKPFIKNF